MKQLSKWLMAATLLCGLFMLTSCEDERDNPVDNGVSDDVIRNREEILSHVKSDAKVLADNMNPEMLNLTNEVYSQLMALMVKDRNYMKNMKQILALMASNSALKHIKPVTKGCELAKMGYLMYIPVDIQTFGVQVVFDQYGASRLFPCEGLEFIFPATVEGLETTLYKVAFRAGSDWRESVAPAKFKNDVKGIACVYRVPKTFTMTLSGLFDDKVLTLSTTTFDIGETQIAGQARTSLKGAGSGLPDVESTVDFLFSTIHDGKVNIGCNYVNNGLKIMTLGARMALPISGSLFEMLSKIDQNGASIDFDMQILDDMKVYGAINDVTQFNQAQFYLTCQHAQQPLTMRFMPEWADSENQFMPGIWSYERFELIPLSAYVGKDDMENVNKVLNVFFPLMGANTQPTIQLFSRIMQMIPLNSSEWGL